MSEKQTKSGFVALVGRPNAGKSTLMNHLLGEKISMVSHKANATRKRINAIVMHKNDQVIFVDTPGLHEREKLLNQFMLEEALKAIGDCDLVLFLAPVTDDIKHYERFLELNDKNRPHILVLTKTDTTTHDKILKKLHEYQKYQDKFLELIPFSVKRSDMNDVLLDNTIKYLPDSPYLYDPEDLTTELLRDIYREFIREAIFENVSDEIPYESDVIIDKIDEEGAIENIKATIVVEKDSQKLVIVGKGGATIKRIGKDSRAKIENLLQRQVYLQLHVSVKKGWTKNKKSLSDLGYDF